DDGRDQLVLAREVAVDGAGAEFGLAEDVLHRRAVEALTCESAQGGREDLAPARLHVLLGDLRHATSILALTANAHYSIKNEHSFFTRGGSPCHRKPSIEIAGRSSACCRCRW